jgi:tRNA G46 methylase TrmB
MIMANTTTLTSTENWNNANAYEDYVGRWSRIISEEFASWLNLPHELRWLEIGCGTGALTKAILHQNQPAHYLASIDPKIILLLHARILKTIELFFRLAT